jgi:hypothetical protein
VARNILDARKGAQSRSFGEMSGIGGDVRLLLRATEIRRMMV